MYCTSSSYVLQLSYTGIILTVILLSVVFSTLLYCAVYSLHYLCYNVVHSTKNVVHPTIMPYVHTCNINIKIQKQRNKKNRKKIEKNGKKTDMAAEVNIRTIFQTLKKKKKFC